MITTEPKPARIRRAARKASHRDCFAQTRPSALRARSRGVDRRGPGSFRGRRPWAKRRRGASSLSLIGYQTSSAKFVGSIASRVSLVTQQARREAGPAASRVPCPSSRVRRPWAKRRRELREPCRRRLRSVCGERSRGAADSAPRVRRHGRPPFFQRRPRCRRAGPAPGCGVGVCVLSAN